jgi:signal peptidase I
VRSPRTGAVTALLALLLATAWIVAGPERLGGSTTYVTTHGTSMEPRFHTGDLALVRASGRYDVGDVVAYRSATLHRVVLHRVVGRRGDRYVFKGDHNDFVDPERPTRAQLVGRLWVRIPHGGAALGLLQSPLVAALLCGGVGVALVAPARHRGRKRRARGRSRAWAPGGAVMTAARRARVPLDPDARLVLAGCAVLAGVCLLVGLLAWTRPATRTGTEKVAYTQKVHFSYRADAPGGAVYPDGVVRTGDPIFLKLVDDVDVKVAYRLDAPARARLSGTQEVRVRLTSPSGWTRTLRLAPETTFSGTAATATVTLDLARIRDLIDRVEALTGTASGAPFTVAILPVVRVKGTVGGAALTTRYAPALSFQLDPLQMRVGTGAAAPGATGADADAGFAPSRAGSVAAPSRAPNHLRALGRSIAVDPARWLALVGLLAAAALAVLTLAHQRRRPTDPYTLIRARYGHLIVPIASYVHDPSQPVVDVTSIDALAQIAIRGERVILHHDRLDSETYLVDDDGTLFRYQPRPHRLPGAVAVAAA